MKRIFREKKGGSFSKISSVAIEAGASGINIFGLTNNEKSKPEITFLDRIPKAQPAGLKKICADNKISHRAIVVIAAKDTQIYNLVFPYMADEELTEAIQWKIAQLRPFGLDAGSLAYDYLKVKNFTAVKTRQLTVVAAAIAKDKIVNKAALLKSAGMKLAGVIPAPFALVNLNGFRVKEANEIVVWLDFGIDESSLIIARGPVLYFYKSLNFTLANIDNQISQRYRISKDEAASARAKYGLKFWAPEKNISGLEAREFSGSDEDKEALIYQSLASSLESLIVDIEHSFKYFSYQMAQSQISKFDRVIISGPGAAIANFDNFLSKRLTSPVEVIKPFSFFEVSKAVSGRKEILSLESEFALCAGAAVTNELQKSLKENKLYIGDAPEILNFMPQVPKEGLELLFDNLRHSPLKLVFVFLALAGISAGLQFSRAAMYKRELKSLTKEITQKKSLVSRQQSKQMGLAEEAGGLEEEAFNLKAHLSFLRAAIRDPEELSKIFGRIADLLVEDIWVNKLSYSQKQITMEGSTSDTKTVMELIDTLKASDDFIDAAFRYTQKDPKEDIYSFEIMISLR